MKFALGKKIGMTTIYNSEGAQNVTLIEILPNKVEGVFSVEKDGRNSVCLSVKKTKNKEYLKEFRFDADSDKKYSVDDVIDVSIFEEGDKVSVSAIAKAKGFQGVVKRHGFAGGPASHGHRHCLRTPGSIGSAYPQHVLKGKRMAGRDGGKRVTVPSLKVVLVDSDKKLIAVKGSVPGVSGRLVEIKCK